jgi:hypothetical protein
MKISSKWLFLLVLFFFLVPGRQVAAQNSFSGVVTDAENEVLPGMYRVTTSSPAGRSAETYGGNYQSYISQS